MRKTTRVPAYGHGLLRRVIGQGYLFSKLNHLRSRWVWHQPCLIPSVIAKPQRNPFMVGAASRNLAEPPAREYIGSVFNQHREELEWLANFLTGDETITAACLVDACALAESENPGRQEWLLKCASLATTRSAVQIQQRRIVQLSFAYKQRPCIHGGHRALSSDWREILVEESSVVIARLDVLCRSALVICGLEKRSADEAAALLGIDPAVVEGAYCAAIKSLEVISCQQFQRQNDFAAVYN
jgi:hypothetical protein